MLSKVLTILENGAKGKKQISKELGQKSISGQLNIIINKLIDNLLILRTIPEKPSSSNQQYYLSERGKNVLKFLKGKAL